MVAHIYDLTVYEGAIARAHDMGRTIKEVWIPDLKLIVNKEFQFHAPGPRHEKDAPVARLDLNADQIQKFSSYEEVLQILERVKEEMKNTIDDLLGET
jgi:phage gp29-like protein